MRKEVIVSFGPGRELGIGLEGQEALSFEASRRWLDQQFLELGCEPVRGSGKVLVLDKILAVALAMGEAGFQDGAWALQYALATSGALGRDQVHVDIAALSVR